MSTLNGYVVTAWGNRKGDANTDDPYAGMGGQYGYYTDYETGYILCTHRYYDPAGGRWLTRDPIEYSGGMNLYGYVTNNPVNRVDPSGLLPNLIPTGKGSAKVDTSVQVFDNEISAAGGLVRINGSGGSKVLAALRVIFSTLTGQKMLKSMRARKRPIWIYSGIKCDPLQYAGAYSSVSSGNSKNVAGAIQIATDCGGLVTDVTGAVGELPFDVILAHEMGHAVYGYSDFSGTGAGDNVNFVENPYRADRRAQIAAGNSTSPRVGRGDYNPRIMYSPSSNPYVY